MKSGILAHTNAFLFNSIFRQMQTENLLAPTQSDSSSIIFDITTQPVSALRKKQKQKSLQN
jgi:hypothetical protein